MNRRFVVLSLFVAMMAIPATSMGQPNDMTLQGVLRTAGGAIVNGIYPMTFNFYDNKLAKDPVFSAIIDEVTVENGVYTALIEFGNEEPAKEYDELWLGIVVEDQEEYPRVPMSSVLYAVRARYANLALDLDCSGCIGEGMLSFDPVTQSELSDGDLVVNGTVTATAFIGDGSGLTGITSPQGSCLPGWFVAGIDADGSLVCEEVASAISSIDGLDGGTINGDVEIGGTLTANGLEVCTEDGNCGESLAQLACDAEELAVWNGDLWTCSGFEDIFDPSVLPADGLNEISNDLLFNQFVDDFDSPNTPVPIKDNNPTGVSDELVAPDVGIAQDLTVTISITNSDLLTVKVVLYDPNNAEYVLYDKNGPGTELGTSYPAPTEPVSGDLTTWIGKNPKGIWRLEVIDTGFKDNETDGQINSWSVGIKTLSSKKVLVKGDLIVDGNITSLGGKGISIDTDGNAAFSGHVKIGQDDEACDDSRKGALRYDGTYGLEVCTGTDWVAAESRPVVWRGYCSSHGNDGGWNKYCLNVSTHNTADKYLTVNGNGDITFKIAGWYRASFWCISNGSSTAHVAMYRNGSHFHYGHEKVHGHWSDNFADEVYTFNEGDTFYVNVHNPGSSAYHSGNSGGAHSGFFITYMGPIAP